MTRYRAILHGEGRRPSGEWFGFYATRDLDAENEERAKAVALASLNDEWTRAMGELSALQVVGCWRPKPWHSRLSAGHCFFNDDVDAQKEAWSIETEAANAPKDVRDLLGLSP
jgi:hypothetical protein